MPPRRSHKKSRAGCRRCKSRKIKCDEVHPRCGNCVKHGVACDFENPEIVEELLSTGSASTASAPTPAAASSIDSPIPLPATPATVTLDPTPPPRSPLFPSSTSSGSSYQPSPTIESDLRLYQTPSTIVSTNGPRNKLLELRLMHQYTSLTSRTLVVNTQGTDDIWQNTVPRLAFGGANYLADAILAVAALHLRSLHPQDKDLVRASHQYMATSLSEYMANLQAGINEHNAEPLFLTATLIAFQSTASRIFIRDDGDADPRDPTTHYALPLSWFHAFQGVKTVVATSWPWLRNSGVVIPIIDSQPALQLDLNNATAPESFFGHLLDGLEDELEEEIRNSTMSMDIDGISIEDTAAVNAAALANQTRQCYHHAISVLNWAHKIPHRGAALAFPATVSKRFVDLVEDRRPRALAILACFFALLKSIDSVWWLHGVARREVMGIASQFERDSPWWPHLEWPVKIALYEGTVIPPEIWGSDWVTEEQHRMHHGGKSTVISHIEILAQAQALNLAQPHLQLQLPTLPAPTDGL